MSSMEHDKAQRAVKPYLTQPRPRSGPQGLGLSWGGLAGRAHRASQWERARRAEGGHEPSARSRMADTIFMPGSSSLYPFDGS